MTSWLETAARELRLIVREWIRHPGRPIVVIATLALGVGATTVALGVAYATLMRPLPFKDSERVVYLAGSGSTSNGTVFLSVSFGDVLKLRPLLTSFSNVSVVSVGSVVISGLPGADGLRLTRAVVSPTAFGMVRAAPALGRAFNEDDERLDAEPVAMLSYPAWVEYFGGDTSVVGRQVRVGTEAETIVGVMPADVRFPTSDVRLWSAARVRPGLAGAAGSSDPDESGLDRRSLVLARVKDGVDFSVATEELNLAYIGLHPEIQRALARGAPMPLKLIGAKTLMVASVHTALELVAVAAAVVLLLACSNASWLTLADAVRRRQDAAIRLSLGATVGRVLTERIVESTLLAVCGGVLGVCLSVAGLQLLQRTLGDAIPRLSEVTFDRSWLVVGMAGSAVAMALAGVLPAIRSAHRYPHSADRRGFDALALSADPRRSTWSIGLTFFQVTSAVLLLITATLLVRSVAHLISTDVGYEPANVVAADLRMPPDPAMTSRQGEIVKELVRRAEALPEVREAAVVGRLPTEPGGAFGGLLQPTGHPERFPVTVTPATRGYRSVMRLRLLEGRWFDQTDRPGAPLAVVISPRLAKQWPGGVAVNQGAGLNGPFQRAPLVVIGVVDDTATGGLDVSQQPTVFANLDQWPATEKLAGLARAVSLVARTDSTEAGARLTKPLGRLAAEVESTLVIDRIATMEQRVARLTERPKGYASVLALFAAVAVVIALVGVYGLLTDVVVLRNHEIAVRMALGARPTQVLWSVLGRCGAATALGIGTGLSMALWTGRYLQGIVVGIEPSDGPTLGAASLAFAIAAIGAAYRPARRAVETNPIEVLRLD